VTAGYSIARKFCDLVGVTYPVIRRGLGPYKTVHLAEVSSAGGLGTVSIPGISEERRAGTGRLVPG
jgi:NAD(P)H-dependent flavin oxidoreductase YrpB (nitropropane dioxygenase family)